MSWLHIYTVKPFLNRLPLYQTPLNTKDGLWSQSFSYTYNPLKLPFKLNILSCSNKDSVQRGFIGYATVKYWALCSTFEYLNNDWTVNLIKNSGVKKRV